MPATAWTELTVTPAGWQDSIPAPSPMIRALATDTAYVLLDVVIPNAYFIEILPGDETWTEMTVAATAQTEMTVAATAWTELT